MYCFNCTASYYNDFDFQSNLDLNLKLFSSGSRTTDGQQQQQQGAAAVVDLYKDVTTRKALSIIFESGLKLNKATLPNGNNNDDDSNDDDELGLCTKCGLTLVDLYFYYCQYMSLSSENSGFVNCLQNSCIWDFNNNYNNNDYDQHYDEEQNNNQDFQDEILIKLEPTTTSSDIELYEDEADDDSNETPPDQLPSSKVQKQEYYRRPKNFICSICSKPYAARLLLGNHYKSVHPSADPSQITFNKRQTPRTTTRIPHSSSTPPPGSGPPKKYKCTQCYKSYPRPYLLKQHLQFVHFGLTHKPVPCPECDKVFRWNASLLKHRKKYHGYIVPTRIAITRHECQQCNKIFSRGFTLKQHVNYVHFGLARTSVPCKECDKVFLRKSTLFKHVQRIHRNPTIPTTNDKKPVSPSLPLSSTTSSSSTTAQKPKKKSKRPYRKDYYCSICPKSYDCRPRLAHHYSKAHPDAAPSQINLQIRPRPRPIPPMTPPPGSGPPKQYKCAECYKSYSNSTCLQEHVSFVHRGLRPVHCPECNKGFSCSETLGKHQRRIHGISRSANGSKIPQQKSSSSSSERRRRK